MFPHATFLPIGSSGRAALDSISFISLRWVRAFNPHDLYSKAAARPDVAALRPFYEDLIAEFFPPAIDW